MRALEDLLTDVRDARSRTHLAEAVAAYQAGAFRAAIISTWVAVALDLVGKVRELAELGEGAAQVFVTELDKAIAVRDVKALGAFEATLLDKCRDEFAFINPREYDELDRLRADRHVCAHPAFVSVDEVFTPTPELVRVHLATAVNAVLSHGPTPGRKALDRFTAETKAAGWPTAMDALVAYLRERYIDRGKEPLRRALAMVVIKGVLTPPDGDEVVAGRLAATAHALEVISPPLLEEALTEVITRKEEGGGLTDENLLRLAGQLGDLAGAWAALPATSHARLLAALEAVSYQDLLRYGVLSTPLANPDAASVVEARLDKLGTLVSGGVEILGKAVAQGTPPHLLPRGLRLLAEAGGWRSAEERMRRLVLPYAAQLTVGHLHEVFAAVRDNGQVREAADMPPMLEQLFEATHHAPGALGAWDAFSAWLTTQGSNGDPTDWFAYPQLRARVDAVLAAQTPAQG